MADLDGSGRASAIAVSRNSIWVELNTGTAFGPRPNGSPLPSMAPTSSQTRLYPVLRHCSPRIRRHTILSVRGIRWAGHEPRAVASPTRSCVRCVRLRSVATCGRGRARRAHSGQRGASASIGVTPCASSMRSIARQPPCRWPCAPSVSPVTQDWLVQQLGDDPRPPVMSGGAPVQWGDPYQAFVGDVRGAWLKTGYGVYYPPIDRRGAGDWRRGGGRRGLVAGSTVCRGRRSATPWWSACPTCSTRRGAPLDGVGRAERSGTRRRITPRCSSDTTTGPRR